MNFYDVLAAEKWGGGIPTTNFFDLLFAQYISGEQWQIYEGTLPATINANGADMRQYQIYGNTGGVGDRTINYFDYTQLVDGYTYDNNGQMILNPDETNRWRFAAIPFIQVTPGATYLRTWNLTPIGNVVNYYDSEKNFMLQTTPGVGAPFTIPNNCHFITYVVDVSRDRKKYMLTEGTTPPASYVPFGYEVDMGVKSGNLFDKETFVSTVLKQRCTASSTQTGFSLTVTGNSPYIGTVYSEGLSVPSQYRPALIKATPNTKYTLSASRLKDGYISYINGSFVSIGYAQFSTDITSATVTTPENTEYLFLRFGKDDAQSGDIINFDNVVLNRGESASYQPYSNTTTPIYIGDDPLDKDEYVDYQSQKVYRMINGTLTPTDPPVALPSLPTCEGETVIDYAGESVAQPEKVVLEYKRGGS